MAKPTTTAISLIACTLLQACTAMNMPRPNPEPGDGNIDIPEVWKSIKGGKQGKVASGWIKTFKDKKLQALVKEALENNRNLQATAARLEATRQQAIAARGRRIPSVNASGSASRTRTGSEPDSNIGAALSSDFGLSMDASWEIDLWGRLRDLDKASYSDYLSAVADFRGARLSLAANTTRGWFDLITAQQLVILAEQTRDSFLRNLRITERNFKAGDDTASPLDVQFGRTNVASAERALVSTKLDRDEAARPLEVLLGRYPSGELQGAKELPPLPPPVPAGIPSELLWRRPDLIAAAADVFSSAKRADASRKDMLPSISLSGRASSASDSLTSALLDPELFVWRAASSIAQTVYQGGIPTAEARQALAQNEAAIREFADTALQAFREVESALATEASLREQETYLETEFQQANLAEEQASRDYSEGIVGILEVLEAQRRAVNARTSMINFRNRVLQNRVDLYLALGGDFETILPADPLKE